MVNLAAVNEKKVDQNYAIFEVFCLENGLSIISYYVRAGGRGCYEVLVSVSVTNSKFGSVGTKLTVSLPWSQKSGCTRDLYHGGLTPNSV